MGKITKYNYCGAIMISLINAISRNSIYIAGMIAMVYISGSALTYQSGPFYEAYSLHESSDFSLWIIVRLLIPFSIPVLFAFAHSLLYADSADSAEFAFTILIDVAFIISYIYIYIPILPHFISLFVSKISLFFSTLALSWYIIYAVLMLIFVLLLVRLLISVLRFVLAASAFGIKLSGAFLLNVPVLFVAVSLVAMTIIILPIFTVLVVFYPLYAAYISGPLFIVNFSICFWISISIVISRFFSQKIQLRPYAIWIIIFFWAAVVNYSQVNDNSAFRQLSPLASPVPTLNEAFGAWISTREDLQAFKAAGKAYPVYLVAAEGGGIYAAAHAAIALARLHKADSRFSKHLFAISAVSGGSLGAAIYQELLSSGKLTEESVTNILRYDFLSPVLLRVLLHDAVQKLFPLPVPFFDRALGLEEGFEDSLCVSKVANSICAGGLSRFGESFYKHWDFGASGTMNAALVLNTTEVSYKRRVAIAPFRFTSHQGLSNSSSPLSLNDISSLINIRTSTAIGLSARFPFITSWGSFFDYKTNETIRFSDGGFSDNSGILTARDIANSIADYCQREGINVDIILISIRTETVPKGRIDPIMESMLAIALLYDDWQRKTETVISEAKAKTSGIKVYDLLLFDRSKILPLTWSLSPHTIDYIASNTEDADCFGEGCAKAALRLLSP